MNKKIFLLLIILHITVIHISCKNDKKDIDRIVNDINDSASFRITEYVKGNCIGSCLDSITNLLKYAWTLDSNRFSTNAKLLRVSTFNQLHIDIIKYGGMCYNITKDPKYGLIVSNSYSILSKKDSAFDFFRSSVLAIEDSLSKNPDKVNFVFMYLDILSQSSFTSLLQELKKEFENSNNALRLITFSSCIDSNEHLYAKLNSDNYGIHDSIDINGWVDVFEKCIGNEKNMSSGKVESDFGNP